jgi:IS5 family transposase
MYIENKQMTIFSNPAHFMGAKLDPENRWVKISQMIPWDEIEEKYKENFSKEMGRPAKPVRMALGSHLIKEKFCLSDEETVELITESPYLQYFLGLEQFESKAPFEASMMTWFRKRLTPEMIAEVNQYVIRGGRKPGKGDKGGEQSGNGPEEAAKEEKPNKGTMIVDATCVPSDIRFPTDVSLLSEAREKSEQLIDALHKEINPPGIRKPRTYRRKARKEYLRFARNRNPKKSDIRKAIKKQLSYLGRNLKTIAGMGEDRLTAKQRDLLETLRTLYAQQKEMYEAKTHAVADRIVSIHSPFVRPIVRGKANAPVEFGAKVAISLVDGFAIVEHLSWDAFNETTTLIDSIERYRKREGFYPERILADKIYRTRESLSFCKANGIRMSGPKLGRPPKDQQEYRKQCLIERAEAGERNAVEGEFGTGKRRYNMDRLSMRLKESSEVQIHLIFLSMNIWKRLKAFSSQILRRLFWALRWPQTA